MQGCLKVRIAYLLLNVFIQRSYLMYLVRFFLTEGCLVKNSFVLILFLLIEFTSAAFFLYNLATDNLSCFIPNVFWQYLKCGSLIQLLICFRTPFFNMSNNKQFLNRRFSSNGGSRIFEKVVFNFYKNVRFAICYNATLCFAFKQFYVYCIFIL